MTGTSVHCPYCSNKQDVGEFENYKPFYMNCESCSKRYIVEPVQNGAMVYRDGEAPCCSDPECRETELGGSGEE